MERTKIKINKKYLRRQTFWDVDFDSLDVVKDRSFIISRVVQRGSDLEILYLNSLLGYGDIFRVLSNYKGIPRRILGYYGNMGIARGIRRNKAAFKGAFGP